MKIFRTIMVCILAVPLLASLMLFSMALFAPRNAASSHDLVAARKGFSTMLIPNRLKADGPPEQPPVGVFRLVRYTSPAGKLAAYLTPPPGSPGGRRPAVIWLKGGWGGIGSFLWDRESGQSPTCFRETGFVVMCPSFRGENDNPGRIEGFYGEVDDVLAAYGYLAGLPYVDPKRIYVAGHSTGGTLAVLTAMASGKPRAVFSFGGQLNAGSYFRVKGILGETPFNWLNSTEIRLRNPAEFAASIKTPLYCFEGEYSADNDGFSLMEKRARELGKPYTGYVVHHADHFDYLPVALCWLADVLQADRGEKFSAPVDTEKLQYLFNKTMRN